MASRRLMMIGSGTCSTRTSCFPYQQFALIRLPPSGNRSQALELVTRRRLRRALRQVTVVPDRAVRDGDFAGLHHLLEAAERLLRLLFGIIAGDLRDPLADDTARRIVRHHHS